MIVGTKWVPSFIDAPRMRGLAVAVGVFAFATAVAMWVASFQS
jgi:hypothetical protein